MTTIKASRHSYGSIRPYSAVAFIIIHFTGVNGDTAEGEGNYFKNSNTRSAGAHFFIDRRGDIVKSIPLNRTAWSVGGAKYSDCRKTGGGKYYKTATNSNSVSIELCDALANKEPSEEQIKAVVRCIKYIRKHCKNSNYLIRHFDVNGKHCPINMCGSSENNKRWLRFKARVFSESGMDK